MKWKKDLPILIALLVLVLVESAFFASCPFCQRNLDLVFLFLLLTLLLSSRSFVSCLAFALAGGLLLDIFSQLTFGTYAVCLPAALFVVFVLFRRFLTNRSYYSLLLLVACGTVVFNFLVVVSSVFFRTVNVNGFGAEFGWPPLLSLFWQLAVNIVIASVCWRMHKSFSRSYA